MIGSWSKWYGFTNDGSLFNFTNDTYGIYKVRGIDKNGLTINIPRIGGIDKEGILYIGRSGLKRNRSFRSILRRLSEFYFGNHSGGWTSDLSYEYCLSYQKAFKNYRYEASILQVPDKEIEKREAKELEDYFVKYGELPPYNSSFPYKLKHKLEKMRKK
jgi:hypothetical protein